MYRSFSGNSLHYLAILLLSAFILTFPKQSEAQGYFKTRVGETNCPVANHEADRWYFGQNAGVDFRNDPPEGDISNYLLNVPTCPAVMSDSNGVPIVYSDGIKVYNKLITQVPGGDGLHGFGGNTMPVLIVPKPGSDSTYYIFTTHRPQQNASDTMSTLYGLEYNEVNILRNGGSGEMIKKNKVLLPPEVSAKLTAVKNSNGIDYWVVGHRFGNNEFCAFRVTANGVDTSGYVSSQVGTPQDGWGETNNAVGYMKISPDGTKLALAIHGKDVFELYNFNAGTGVVSLIETSPATFDEAYSVEFSPDSKFLYGTTTSTDLPQPNYTPPSYLFQFDLSLSANRFVAGNYDTIALDTNGSYLSGMQLATDGKIYISRVPYGNAALSVIENPKRPGLECNFRAGALDLQGKRSRAGFPNFITSYFDLPHFDVENVCFTDVTNFVLQNSSNITNATWQFTDGNAVTLNGIQPSYTFSGPGTYDVKVTETFTSGSGTKTYEYTETVTVIELPPVDIGDTTYMYPGSPILLDAGEGFVSYEWSTGQNSQTITVSEPGTYTVNVQNDHCCFKVDSVLVLYFDVRVPNAFKPGGVNSIFRAYASSLDAINNFNMYIYNRWGQQIFVSNDINVGWDGTIDGKEAPGDVYVWLVTYDVERVGKIEKVAYKGNVVLLR